MPLLALGLTTTRFDVGRLLMQIAERRGVPIVVTPMAKGLIPESHPSYAGVLFHALSDIVAETHRQADLVIGVGYDPVEFNYESWLHQVPLIHIDTTPADIDCSRIDLACDLVGDITPALERLADLEVRVTEWDLEALAERRFAMFERLRPPEGSFGPRAALDVLRDLLPSDGVMACDVGAHTHLIGQQWRTPPGGKLLMTNGWSSMGFGIPAAIAAKMCLPERPVCCVVGDGGLLMMAGEMETAARLNLQIVFVVLTDRCLSLIRIKQQRKGQPVYGTPTRRAPHSLGDSLLGVQVFAASDVSDYRTALKHAFSADGPAIVEAFIDGAEYDDLVLTEDRV
jgi:acetolactate synthase-1/2/3 large subunit